MPADQVKDDAVNHESIVNDTEEPVTCPTDIGVGIRYFENNREEKVNQDNGYTQHQGAIENVLLGQGELDFEMAFQEY